MSVLDRPERFDLKGVTRDAEVLYPHVLAAIRCKYPDYALKWDRWRERWLIVRVMGPEKIEIVCPVENSDGTYAEPSMVLVEKLHLSDWINFYPTHEAFIEALEKQEEDFKARWDADKRAEWDRVTKAIVGHIERDPASVGIVLKPYMAEHRRQIESAMTYKEAQP